MAKIPGAAANERIGNRGDWDAQAEKQSRRAPSASSSPATGRVVRVTRQAHGMIGKKRSRKRRLLGTRLVAAVDQPRSAANARQALTFDRP